MNMSQYFTPFYDEIQAFIRLKVKATENKNKKFASLKKDVKKRLKIRIVCKKINHI